MNDAPLTEAERERVAKALENVPFAKLLGIEVLEVKRGEALLCLEVGDRMKQNNRVMHGGAIASLIDTAAAFAILPLLKPDQTTTTIDLTIHYLRPLTTGKTTARARVVRAGRRIIVVAVDVLDDAQNVAATALTNYIRLT
jgi:acyl-CoA thioesterase